MSHNFESSFTQILNRTQQNLNRINQRYASGPAGPAAVGPAAPPPPLPPTHPPLSSSIGSDHWPSALSNHPSNAFLGSTATGSGGGFHFSGGPPLATNKSNEFNHHQNYAPSSSSSLQLLPQSTAFNSQYTQPLLQRASSAPQRSNTNNTSEQRGNLVAVEEDVLQSILHRLSYLEKTVDDHQQFASQIAANERLSKAVDSNMNDVFLEMKDLHRQFSQQQNRLTVIQSLCDSLTLEQEQRKMSSLKMENWMRETESWREDINTVLSSLKRQESASSRSQSDVKQLLAENYLTKQDFENFRDKVYLLSQQSVASALSAWNDTNEMKIKQLEREIAIVKLSQTKAVQQEISELSKTATGEGGANASTYDDLSNADLVAKVLNTPIPSEMVIRGAVSTEVRNLENHLESKLDSRFLNMIQNEFQQSRQALVNHINHQVLAICTDSLLYSDLTTSNAPNLLAASTAARQQAALPPPLSSHRSNSTTAIGGNNNNLGSLDFNQMLQLNNSLLSSMNHHPGSSLEEKHPDKAPNMSDEQLRLEFERRVITGKNKMENMERKFLDKIASLEKSIMIIQEKYDLNDKNFLVKLVNVENKVENQQEIAQQQMINYQNKLQSYELALRENEIKLKELMEKHQQLNVEKLHGMNTEFMNERLSLERRLIIVERIAQESLENQKHSQQILHQSILSHPTILQLNNSLKETAHLSQDLTLLQQEFRGLQNDLFKIQSTMVPMTDFLFYKEKLMKCDHVINEKIPEYLESTKKLLDFSQLVTTKQEHYDYLLNRMNAESTSVANKVETLNLQTIQVQGNVTTMTEETKLLKTRVNQLETTSQREINSIKDLSGSLASRLQSNENQMVTMNRTRATEAASFSQQIKLLEEKLDFYEKMATAQPRYAYPPPAATDPPSVSNLAALGKTTSTFSVAPLTMLSSSVPLSTSTVTIPTSDVTAPTAVPTLSKEKEPLLVKSVVTAPTITPASTATPLEKKPSKIVKHEFRGVPPVLITTVVDASDGEGEEEVVQSFDPLESSFDSQPPVGASFGRRPLNTTVSSIPVVNSTTTSSNPNTANNSSLLNSISLLDTSSLKKEEEDEEEEKKQPSSVSQGNLKTGVPVGKVPNEWDEDSFDSNDETEKPNPSSQRGDQQPVVADDLESSFAPTEEDEDEDEKLMSSVPAMMVDTRQGQQTKRREPEDSEEPGDESDADFDQLTAQIQQMKQFKEQNLNKYSPTKANPQQLAPTGAAAAAATTTDLENSFDQSSFASESSSPVKPSQPTTTSSTAAVAKKALEEDDEFDDEAINSVLLYDKPTTTTPTAIANKKTIVPPLSFSNLSQVKATESTLANRSNPSSMAAISFTAPQNPRRGDDEESELASISQSPTKPAAAHTATNAFDVSDWDASMEATEQSFQKSGSIDDRDTSAINEGNTYFASKLPAAVPSRPPSVKDPSSNSSQSNLSNSFDQSSSVVNTSVSSGRQLPTAMQAKESSTSSLFSSSEGSSGAKTKQGIPVPKLSLEGLKKENEEPSPVPSSLTAAFPSKTSATAVTSVRSAADDNASFLENSFDESSVDVSIDARPIASKTAAIVPPPPARSDSQGEKLEINTNDIIGSSLSAMKQPALKSSSSFVAAAAAAASPVPTTGSTTPVTGTTEKEKEKASTSTQAIRERLRARQEALKQQRQSSGSSTPVRSRAPSPPTISFATSTPTTSTAIAGLQKKPSILDTLDEDSSLSSGSSATKQPAAVIAKPPPSAASFIKKPSTVTATDEVQSFEEVDESSFDF